MYLGIRIESSFFVWPDGGDGTRSFAGRLGQTLRDFGTIGKMSPLMDKIAIVILHIYYM